MKKWNSIEEQLQSWVPREPSRNLERRLFAKPAPQPGRRPWRLTLNLLPATAVVVVVGLLAWHHLFHADNLTRQHAGVLLASVTLSNYFQAPFDGPSMQSDVNAVEIASVPANFDWTNTSLFPSSIGSFKGGQTNRLQP